MSHGSAQSRRLRLRTDLARHTARWATRTPTRLHSGSNRRRLDRDRASGSTSTILPSASHRQCCCLNKVAIWPVYKSR